jgi:phage shock protein PspC (stress-responsive transcriptional regulator)
MKRNFSVNIGGRLFNIDEDAFNSLKAYQAGLEKYFAANPDSREILSDIEMRIAELLSGRLNSGKIVIGIDDIEQVITEMGQANQMDDDEKSAQPEPASVKSGRKLFRDSENRLVGGVAAGIAALLGIQVWIVRIVFIIMVFGYFVGPLLYFVLWLILPEASTVAEQLQMRGKAVTVENLEKKRSESAGREGTDRVLETTGQIIRTLSDTLLKLLRFAGIALKKIFGLVLLLLVAGLIIGFGTALLVNEHFHFGNFRLESVGFTDYFDWLVPLAGIQWQIFLAAALFGLGMFGLLTSLGLRLFVNWPPLKWQAIMGFVVLILAGLFVGGSAVFEIKNASDEQQWLRTEKVLQPKGEKGFSLVIHDMGFDEFISRDLAAVSGKPSAYEKFAISDIDFSILATDGDSIRLVSMASAFGRNDKQALEFASHVAHNCLVRDSVLEMDRQFRMPFADGFRNQRLRIELNLPAQTRVYLDENALQQINWSDFANDERDEGWYRMTPKGLEGIEETSDIPVIEKN